MQRFLPAAIVIGALVVAAALVFHGRQLSGLAGRLAAMERRTGELDVRLNTFSTELPAIIGQAGNEAGRQAVDGIIDGLAQKFLGRSWSGPRPASSNAIRRARAPAEAGRLPDEGGIPLIRFDIPDTVFNIQILPGLKELPPLPWLPPGNGAPPADMTNTAPSTLNKSGS